jgi:hypothetical protein
MTPENHRNIDVALFENSVTRDEAVDASAQKNTNARKNASVRQTEQSRNEN